MYLCFMGSEGKLWISLRTPGRLFIKTCCASRTVDVSLTKLSVHHSRKRKVFIKRNRRTRERALGTARRADLVPMTRRVRLLPNSQSFFYRNSSSSKRRGVRLDFCCLFIGCVTSFLFLATTTFAGRARRDRANGATTTLHEESETSRMRRAQSTHASILPTPVQNACGVFSTPANDGADRSATRFTKRVGARVAGVSFDMYVYGGTNGVRDIVSESIASRGAWEREDTERLMRLFPCKEEETTSAPMTNASVARSCIPNSFNGKKGVFLDIGANIGWFSLVALSLGHSVIAFEPFERNVELICTSLHALETKGVRRNFRLHRRGLDYKQRECELFQQENVNVGDTHSICDKETRRQFSTRGYTRLGWMNTTTLDDALLEGAFDGFDGVDIMKIDVEGFEPSVIAGGNRFFESKYAPKYIFMESVSSYMGLAVGAETRGKDLLTTVLVHLGNHGYDLHSSSLKGATNVSLKTSTFEELRRVVDGGNILFVRCDSARS